MRSIFLIVVAFLLCPHAATGQARGQVEYTLRVDAADLSGITVEMRIHNATAEFRIAMVVHTEYDDQYWRFLSDLRGESARGPVQVTREDSSRWRVTGPAGEVTLHYRVRFPASPPMQQASWKAHLTPTGGLVGGPHSFLYVLGRERSPVQVTLLLPADWHVATGLAFNAGAGSYTAPSVESLVDSPMLVGLLRSWQFTIAGVPHQIAYLGQPAGVPFDTALFAGKVERFAREAVRMFGRMPYHDYHFLFEDGTFGGLEHLNSVSIGTQSSNLARDPDLLNGQIAHEFFHTWNEVNLRPVSWIGVRHVAPDPTGELWWSEGVTLYFADILLRRAGLSTVDSTRVAHLERLLTNFTANPSHGLLSPEATSRAFNQPPAATGDFTPSMFTQGELLGTVLDLMVRERSNDRRTLDDVMRALLSRFSPARGFTGADLEHAVGAACGCDADPFFATYVRSAGAPDFDQWLAVIGLHATVTWAPALTSDRTPAPDTRISASTDRSGTPLQLKIWFPATLWGRAGLHTGDRLDSWNGVAIADPQRFREALGRLRVGDTVVVSVWRGSAKLTRTIPITGYDRPAVRLEVRPDATPAQRRRLGNWKAGSGGEIPPPR